MKNENEQKAPGVFIPGSELPGDVPSVYCAIRDGHELDVIVFADNDACIAFCSQRPEYEPLHTGLHSLQSALALFDAAEGAA